MPLRRQMAQIPGKVRSATTDTWALLTALFDPDDPQARDRIITWAFGSLTLEELLFTIRERRDISEATDKMLNENKVYGHVGRGIICAQWKNIDEVLMNPALVLDYFNRYSQEHYRILNTRDGVDYLNWMCPRLHEYLKDIVENGHKSK